MARAKIVHSTDAATIIFEGDKRSPEPSTGIILFPGGSVEVSRTTDGQYWAHVAIKEGAAITDSRIDYQHDAYKRNNRAIPPIPAHEDIQHMAILVGKN